MWKGQLRLPSGTDGRQFATDGRQSASQSCSPRGIQRTGNVSICVLPRERDSTTIYTQGTDLKGGMDLAKWAWSLFWTHFIQGVLPFRHCINSTHISNVLVMTWPITLLWLQIVQSNTGKSVLICSVPPSYCWLLQMSTKVLKQLFSCATVMSHISPISSCAVRVLKF